MTITIHREFDPYFEGLWAVQALCCGEGPRALAERTAKMHPVREAEVRALFAPLLGVQDALEAVLNLDDENLRFLFGPREELGDTLCALFQLPARYEHVDDGVILALFSDFLLGDEEGVKFADGDALIAHIRALPHSMADKSALLYTYLNYRELLAFARKTAAAATAVVDAHRAEIAPLTEKVMGFWETRAADGDGLRTAFAELGVPISLDEGHYTLYPTLFRPNALTMLSYDKEDGGIQMHCGVFLVEMLNLKREGEGVPDKLSDVLKALSDKTKLEIMTMLRTERLYGSQLAERLGLTAATISYHLSQLTARRLIRLTKEGGRYYCELEHAAIEQFLDTLRQRLLP